MSAFIVSDETMEAVLFAVFKKSSVWLTHDLRTSKGMRELGQELVNLNYQAVNYRYNEEDEPHKFVYKSTGHKYNKFQQLKSIQCLLYQCSEGNVPENNYYKELKRIEKSLISEIVHSLKEYDEAQWDIAA